MFNCCFCNTVGQSRAMVEITVSVWRLSANDIAAKITPIGRTSISHTWLYNCVSVFPALTEGDFLIILTVCFLFHSVLMGDLSHILKGYTLYDGYEVDHYIFSKACEFATWYMFYIHWGRIFMHLYDIMVVLVEKAQFSWYLIYYQILTTRPPK